MEYRFETVWKNQTPALLDEIIAFWAQEKALNTEQLAQQRAKQSVVVMRDEKGGIAAVSTAIARVLPRLRQPMFYYRSFCAEAHRGQNTSIPMMKASQKALHEYVLAMDKPIAIGIIIEIENKMLSEHFKQAFWPRTVFSFIGYSPRELPMYAHYFPEMKLMPPVKAQARKA